MAIIRLGEGEEYEGRVVAAKSEGHTQPDEVGIVCHTSKGDGQKNFPICLTLEHDEALNLAAGICNALMVPPPPPEAEVVEFGEDMTAPL